MADFSWAIVDPGKPITDELWDWMCPGLEDVMLYDMFPTDLDNLRERIEGGDAFICLFFNSKKPAAFLIAEMVDLGEKQAIYIPWLWVEKGATGVLRFGMEEVSKFAKDQGCEYMLGRTSRKGWLRYFEPMSMNLVRKL